MDARNDTRYKWTLLALFGGTYAIGAVALLVARLCFFKKDKVG